MPGQAPKRSARIVERIVPERRRARRPRPRRTACGPQTKTCGRSAGGGPISRQHLGVHPPAEPGPARRAGARQRVPDARVRERVELGPEEDVLLRSRRQQQPRVERAAPFTLVAQHRRQRDDARAAADEQQRPAVLDLPGEVAADRAAQLDGVARPQLVGQVRRDLAVVEALDRQRERGSLGRRGDRVRALGDVAVLGGQPDVDVLPRAVPGPAGHVEDDRLRTGCLRRRSRAPSRPARRSGRARRSARQSPQ